VSKAKSPKDILSRMKAVAARERKPAGESTAPAPEAPKKKVRITVDLDPEVHRFLKVYAAEKGVRISDVIRNLISTLER